MLDREPGTHFAEPSVRPTAPYRISHFLTPLLLIPAGIAAGSLGDREIIDDEK